MSDWPLLERELDAWRTMGRRVTLWLRDDDAYRDCDALRTLLALAGDHRVPVAVAAVPAAVEASLVEAIAQFDGATLVQHGYAHRNHAAAGERSSELGPARALDARLDELLRGRDVLVREFGDRFVPVLVPPWNRMGEDLLPRLASSGFRAVSRFGPRPVPFCAPGMLQVNTHVDPIAWRRGRGFIGDEPAIQRLTSHLAARRHGECDADEPTGILTHHLAFTGEMWKFLDALFELTGDHGAVTWLDVTRACAARIPPLTSARSA